MPLLDSSVPLAGGPIARMPDASEADDEAPGALFTVDAALRQNNLVSGLYDRAQLRGMYGEEVPVAGYDPLDEVTGYEAFADRFLESRSPVQTRRIKTQIGQELADRDTLHRAGGWGLVSAIGAGVTDPATLASMAIPMAGETRLARVGSMVATQMAADTASEIAFHQLQQTRTAQESILNIAGSTVLTGLLGPLAARVPKAQLDRLAAKFDEEMAAPAPEPMSLNSTAGAAWRHGGTTLEQETIAKGGETIAKTIGKISPLARVLTSPSKRARQVAQDLAETPFALSKNEADIASPVAAETATKRYDALLGALGPKLDELYTAARSRMKQAGESVPSFREFKELVTAAMRRGDEAGIPEVARAAAWSRRNIIEPLKTRLQQVGLLPEEVHTIGAESYFPRLYDIPKIKANLLQWQAALRGHFVSEGLDAGDARVLESTVTESILGSTRGLVQLRDPNIVVKAGALQERTLRVPDDVLEPFLVNDAEAVLSRYVRSVAPQIEISRKFGDLNMDQAFTDVTAEYHVLKEQATTNPAKAQLEARMKQDMADLLGMRDRLLGTYGLPADPDSRLVRGARLMRQYNYVRLLGGQVLSSMADAGRIITEVGMARTAKALGVFATDVGRWKLARQDAKRLGIGLDWVLNTRGASLGDIAEFAETRLERYAERASSTFTRATGMATWNSSMKFLATALQQDQLLDLVARSRLTANQRTKLAQIGIDSDMATRIAEQAAKHGDGSEGLRRGMASKWDDKDAREVFEAALIKSADTMVLTKGIGDTPLLMSTELAKTLLQFQSFGMAAVTRLMIPAAQGLARGDIAMLNGLLVMLALGELRYVAKQWTSGQPIETDPATTMREAIDGAGLSTYLVQPYDIGADIFGWPRFSRFSDRSWEESALGPSAGSLTDFGRTVKGVASGGISQQDIHQFRKLLPGQNIFYLRRAINALEEEAGDALGAE